MLLKTFIDCIDARENTPELAKAIVSAVNEDTDNFLDPIKSLMRANLSKTATTVPLPMTDKFS